MTHQFYITLPSNSSMDLYPENKTSSYKVHLSNPIQLDPARWEVALSEIQFLHSWYNVRENKNTLFKKVYHPTLKEEKSILPDHLKNITQPSGSTLSDVIVPIGYYSDVEEIVTQLNRSEKIY